MRAMILAAGRGSRMRELTMHTPKPLLRVGNQYLIEYAIQSLKQAGINDIIINVSYQGEQIKQALGNGERYGLRFFYSEEPERLETGGGIFQALPLLGQEPFLAMSSDIITDYPLQTLLRHKSSLAHLVVVDNMPHHPRGDFGLKQGVIDANAKPPYTYANMSIIHPRLFDDCKPGCFPLRDVLLPAVSRGLVTGEYYGGSWYNIGTPEELASANAAFSLI